MNAFKLGRQTERAGIDPTLPVVLVKGIALEEDFNKLPYHIRKDYSHDKGNPLFDPILYHVIKSLFLRPLDGRT